MGHEDEFVCHYPLGCHHIQNGSSHREKHCYGKYHFIPVHQEVYSKPYLKSGQDQGGQHADPRLEKPGPVCGYREDARCYKHDQENQVWSLLVISYYFLSPFRTYDGRKAAEEH